jgi:beta-lactamase class C
MTRLLIFIFLFFSTSVFADGVDDIYLSDLVKSNVMPFMRINKIPGVAVSIYLNGVPHNYYFGYANLTTQQPVTGNTIFEIGSITKLFTSLLLAEEVKAGRVNLEKNVDTILPDFSASLKAFHSITLEQLATHTSGLPFDVSPNVKTREQLVRHLRWWHFPLPNMHSWIYSNVGMGLLGNSLEALTGQSFNDLYRRNILAPLGMQEIGINVPEALVSEYAQGYRTDGSPAPRVNLAAREASGSIKASATDMSRFLAAAMGLPGTPDFILSSMRLTQTPFVQLPTFEQGLGWQIYALNNKKIASMLRPPALMHVGPIPSKPVFILSRHFDSDHLFDKTGTTAGFRAYIALIPNRKTGIVILTNRRVSDPALLGTARRILFKIDGIT